MTRSYARTCECCKNPKESLLTFIVRTSSRADREPLTMTCLHYYPKSKTYVHPMCPMSYVVQKKCLYIAPPNPNARNHEEHPLPPVSRPDDRDRISCFCGSQKRSRPSHCSFQIQIFSNTSTDQ